MPRNRTALLAAALVLTARATAQTPMSEGPLAFTPGVFSFDSASAPKSQLRMKRPGFAEPLADFSAPAFRPRYDLAADFSALTGACKPTGPIDIDAMSTGLDWVLSDGAGNALVLPQRWGFLAFSVRRGSKGKPGSAIAREKNPESSLFYHILRGSTLDAGPGQRPGPAGLVGRTMRALSRTELGAGATDELDALDLHMNAFRMRADIFQRIRPWTGHAPRFYFSVSRATAKNIPIGWTPDVSGAVIFYREWSALTRTWSCPQVYVNHLLLGIPDTYDVLAIAVDSRHQRLLLSVVDDKGATFKDPLLFFNMAGDFATLVPYGGKDPVSKQLELEETDTVDGVCGSDPTFTDLKYGTHPIAYMMGTPMRQEAAAVFQNTGSATASAFVDFPCPSGGVELKFFVAGWQPSGEGSGLTAWSLVGTGFESPWFVAPRVAQRTQGSPERRSLCMPDLPPGYLFRVRWLVAGQPIAADVAEAFPLGMSTPN
ncbi:MAG: hypothetical protein KDC87_21285 [Planctomycetes bacterium]|nr:hypothetical protein [Planctomycetota bacterium]MCB9869245.1 hypothetical protein [Planctomycetota bacterium]MCB9889356.1 hypothetical protein [Planctomycetota bacterium]